MNSPSPTSSISSGNNSLISLKNGPQNNEYLRSNKSIYLTYPEGSNSFQQGPLGDNDTFLAGNIHLNYNKPCQVKSVYLHLKGAEKTSWYRSQARSKSSFNGEHTLVDQTNKVWEAFDDSEEITTLDIPFKIQLPYNLSDSITTETGSVQYILRATVNTKSLIGSQQTVKLIIPLKRSILLDNQSIPPFKLSGETPTGIDYTFILPPNKSFNLGSYVAIPLKLRFLQPGVGIEKLEICLRTTMDFQSSTQGETKRVEQKIMGLVVQRTDLLYSQLITNQCYGECTHTINLFIPKKVQPTYQGRYISIAHFLSIKFYLWGYQMDFHVEESVRIANIVEKHPQLQSNTVQMTPKSAPLTPQFTPPLPPSHAPTPPPMHPQYFLYNNEIGNNSVESTTYFHNQYYQQNLERKTSLDHPKDFYDKPFDGYNSPQNYNYQVYYNNGQFYQPENSGSQTSRTSTPSIETNGSSSNEFSVGQAPFPTHLSPPPYRQAARQP